jgi:GntR family transcriptional regulator, transcriptional repressor for pyruvate dehydrogenase complex
MAVKLRAQVRPALSLKRASRQKLAETVAHQLLEAIHDLPAGTRLPPERELTRELGVGRTTVREALNGLALLGAVETRHGQGAFVAARRDQSPRALDALERALTKASPGNFLRHGYWSG